VIVGKVRGEDNVTDSAVVVRFGLRAGPVKREILRYAWKTAPLRMTVAG